MERQKEKKCTTTLLLVRYRHRELGILGRMLHYMTWVPELPYCRILFFAMSRRNLFVASL